MGFETVPARGTQSFVGTLSSCWRRPSLTALEVGWRWVFGVPALLLVLQQMHGVLAAVTGGTLDPARVGLDSVLLNDPVGALSADPLGASSKFANALSLILPGIEHFAVWLVPALFVGWVILSSVGRTLMLRRADRTLHIRIGTLVVLHAVRAGALGLVLWGWFAAVQWASRFAITGPIAQRADPNLVLYCGLVIVITLVIFTSWAAVNWVVGIAPLVAMRRNLGAFASLGATLTLGPVRGKLIEINLVLGIVKITLIVLAMVFSATPLPFSAVTTAEFLAWWWTGVALLYVLWSDFFHVARLVGYLDLWREAEVPVATDADKIDKTDKTDKRGAGPELSPAN